MKLRELLEKLEHKFKDNEVVLARDPEGNGFSTIDEIVQYPGRIIIWPGNEVDEDE